MCVVSDLIRFKRYHAILVVNTHQSNLQVIHQTHLSGQFDDELIHHHQIALICQTLGGWVSHIFHVDFVYGCPTCL